MGSETAAPQKPTGQFSSVRIHTGPRATELNHRIQAQAFTLGSDVFFRDGEPSASSSGTRLLAHELTHTIQQGGARSVRRTVAGRRRARRATPRTSRPAEARYSSGQG